MVLKVYGMKMPVVTIYIELKKLRLERCMCCTAPSYQKELNYIWYGMQPMSEKSPMQYCITSCITLCGIRNVWYYIVFVWNSI